MNSITAEEYREYQRIRYLAFPQIIRKTNDAWAKRNPWYHQIIDSIANRRRVKEWRSNNPAKARALDAIKRARRSKATIGDQKAICKIYIRCRELCRWFDVVVDHIVPLSKGGAHAANNLQIIYRKENEKKHNSLFFKPSVVFL